MSGPLFNALSTLAKALNQNSPITTALVLAKIAQAGTAGVFRSTVQRELDIPPAVLTRTIQALVDKGLVSRSIDNADLRHRILTLTEGGQSLVDHVTACSSRSSERCGNKNIG
jgi:DNA-binding MarR family transcriptional regulator